MTSNNSRDIKFLRIKNNRDNSSDNRSFENSSVSRSPEIAYRPSAAHFKHKSQDKIIKKYPKQAKNIPFFKKSPRRVISNNHKHIK